MKSAAETLTPTRVKLTVEVPYEELKPSIDRAYKAIGSQIQVPGFRAGKIPSRIIDQRVGKGAVLQEAVNEALPGLYGQAVDEAGVRPLGQPEVEITQVPMDDTQALAFTAEVDIRPEITLPDLDALAVSVDDIEVTDDEVLERLDQLRTRFGSLAPVERAVEDGDFVTIDLGATIDDEEIDSVSGISYEVGSGNMLPGLDEALIGLSAGDTTTFTAPLAGGDKAGVDAECTVTVEAVKVRELPELDDEFAQLASQFDTLDELKADLSTAVERDKKFQQGVQARDRILEHLLETLDIPLPDGVIEAEVHSHLEGEGRLGDDVHRAEVDESTRNMLKTQLILDKLAEDTEVSVSQEEFVEYLIMQAQQSRMDPNEFAKALDDADQVPAMVAEVARRKALASLLDRASITDASGNVVDLSEIVEEDGDDEEFDEFAEYELDDDADDEFDIEATDSEATATDATVEDTADAATDTDSADTDSAEAATEGASDTVTEGDPTDARA